jgi:hypothetical protein
LGKKKKQASTSKKANQKIELVRDKCRTDPVWFGDNCVMTEDPQAAQTCRPWPHWDYLNDCERHIWENQVTVIEKSRQLSVTWMLCKFAINMSAFNESRQGLIQSEKEAKAKALIPRCKYILRHLPDGLLPCSWEATTDRILFTFPNGDESWIVSVPHGPDQVASYSPTYVIFDEASLQSELEAAWTSTAPLLRGDPRYNKVIACGTPRGHNYFHTLCRVTQKHNLVRCHYRQHPVYAAEAESMGGWEKWVREKMVLWGYRTQSGQLDHARWEREMEINWDVSGGKVAFRPPFSKKIHVKPLRVNPAYPVIRGWDFGFHNPACVWFQIHPVTGQLFILRELLGRDVQLHQFTQQVLQFSREIMPASPPYTTPRGPFEDYCDLAGTQKKDSGQTCIQILNENRIYPSYRRSKPLNRVRMIQRQMNMIQDGEQARPGMLIDPSCEMLIRGFNGGCTFKTKKGDDGTISERPDFGIFVHLIDALGYGLDNKYLMGAGADGKRHH